MRSYERPSPPDSALSKASLLHACQYQDDDGRFCNPKWVDLNSRGEYRPSYNISPRNYHPVMLSSVHVPKSARGRTGHRIMMSPMRWGLVPSWFSGEPQNFIFNTVNCRLESCMDRRSFKGAIAAERRCVVVAEGFFEWKNETNGNKQPYYVYFKQPRGVDMAAREWDGVTDAHQLMHNGHWIGPRLLTMAGIFDVSTSKDVLYSYSILTMDAPRYLQWLHNRVPVILDGEEAVASWLDPNYTFEEAQGKQRGGQAQEACLQIALQARQEGSQEPLPVIRDVGQLPLLVVEHPLPPPLPLQGGDAEALQDAPPHSFRLLGATPTQALAQTQRLPSPWPLVLRGVR
ncbi:abasic site processing protein HMCES-like isoform X3 [Dermacentor andersoni]|uniref:abasic site processing protein HMCES-like isoform X3 n=1 Tax=Dermacentor andersoni TaxID=34620 RepID=UPI0024172D32|nr:abasic site processing protein HMCES-like isoform X3 [Dermacentor andersoni]